MSRTYEIDITPARLRRSLSGLGADRPPSTPQPLSPDNSVSDFVIHWKNKSFEQRGSYPENRKIPRINILVATALHAHMRQMAGLAFLGSSKLSNIAVDFHARFKREQLVWKSRTTPVFAAWDGKVVKGTGDEYDLTFEQAKTFWDATYTFAVQINGYTSQILQNDKYGIGDALLESAKNAPAVIVNALTKAAGTTIRFGTELATGATKAVVGGFFGGLVAGLGPTLSVLLAAGGGFLAYNAIKGRPLPESVSRAGRWARDKVRRKKPLDGVEFKVVLLRGGKGDKVFREKSPAAAANRAHQLAQQHSAGVEKSRGTWYVMADQYYAR